MLQERGAGGSRQPLPHVGAVPCPDGPQVTHMLPKTLTYGGIKQYARSTAALFSVLLVLDPLFPTF